MSSVNKVILVGNLGRDSEMRYTANGSAVATLNLATTEKWTKDGEKKEQTEWHRVIVWGKTAESLHEYLTKGKQVYVEGKLTTRKWTDKDGKDRYSTEIKADRVTLLGGGSKREADAPTLPGGFQQTDEQPVEDDSNSIPF